MDGGKTPTDLKPAASSFQQHRQLQTRCASKSREQGSLISLIGASDSGFYVLAWQDLMPFLTVVMELVRNSYWKLKCKKKTFVALQLHCFFHTLPLYIASPHRDFRKSLWTVKKTLNCVENCYKLTQLYSKYSIIMAELRLCRVYQFAAQMKSGWDHKNDAFGHVTVFFH